ncbi:MAG: hypothetical protein IT538_14110 [Variibacter sp.]|nr:hypothetical protein [Variibacter sp.]
MALLDIAMALLDIAMALLDFVVALLDIAVALLDFVLALLDFVPRLPIRQPPPRPEASAPTSINREPRSSSPGSFMKWRACCREASSCTVWNLMAGVVPRNGVFRPRMPVRAQDAITTRCQEHHVGGATLRSVRQTGQNRAGFGNKAGQPTGDGWSGRRHSNSLEFEGIEAGLPDPIADHRGAGPVNTLESREDGSSAEAPGAVDRLRKWDDSWTLTLDPAEWFSRSLHRASPLPRASSGTSVASAAPTAPGLKAQQFGFACQIGGETLQFAGRCRLRADGRRIDGRRGRE